MQELLEYSLSFFSVFRRETERAVRTEHQSTLPLSSLTTSTGGLGYCEFGGKYFKGCWSTGLGLGFLVGFRLCFTEMKHTWFRAMPLNRQELINLLFLMTSNIVMKIVLGVRPLCFQSLSSSEKTLYLSKSVT